MGQRLALPPTTADFVTLRIRKPFQKWGMTCIFQEKSGLDTKIFDWFPDQKEIKNRF